jgi:hypothetical protein
MDHPMDLEPIRAPKTLFAGLDAARTEAFDSSEIERGEFYAEIAERRAQLECAETLRRVRAL